MAKTSTLGITCNLSREHSFIPAFLSHDRHQYCLPSHATVSGLDIGCRSQCQCRAKLVHFLTQISTDKHVDDSETVQSLHAYTAQGQRYVGMHVDIYELIFILQDDVYSHYWALYSMPMWTALTFIQGHKGASKQELLCLSSYGSAWNSIYCDFFFV